MESLETMQARHRKEQRDLQARITNKKKNATKKTRKGVNDECAELERQLKEKQEQEITALNGEDVRNGQEAQQDEGEPQNRQVNGTTPADATNEISQQLKDTTLSQPSEPEPPTQQQQQPKKRNRQKERMARRAAEQEAAAVAAEQEAANMTDHRKIEKTYLLKEFKANNLVEKEIQPDGHCLFSAIADQLETRGVSLGPETETKGKPSYRIVRKVATDYMEAHPDDFAPFLEEPLGSYVPKIRDTAEWGGQLELSALANAYGVEIKVLQDGRTETIEPNGSTGSVQDGERKRIWLAYYRHGYGLGEHYNSLRQAN
ncbi:OTU-domain-containing protein [Hypoxylon sp. NC0597]|nr:OTU-domain-containing protein [Hypoxylon sp. NC0597]